MTRFLIWLFGSSSQPPVMESMDRATDYDWFKRRLELHEERTEQELASARVLPFRVER